MKKQIHRLLILMLSLILVVGMIPGSLMTVHAAVGEIETITDEELLEVMEVDLRIGHEIIASSESTSFSKMSNPGHWELKLSKQDNTNRMQYYIVLHLYDYDVPDGYIDFMYDMKPAADPANSVSFQVSVHGDCQVGFIRALTTDKEKVYGSSLNIIFAAGATLDTKQIVHRGTGQWGSDIELNLRGVPGEQPGILYTKEILNSYYFINWPQGSEVVTYADNLIIINYDTPTNGGPLFTHGEDFATATQVQFTETVDLFLNTRYGHFPIFEEHTNEKLAQKYQYIEDDGITAFSDLRAHLWLRESGDLADEYTVGDSIYYYFFPELTMLDFLFKNGINEQFKGGTRGFKVESSYELTNLSRSTKVASDTVTGIEKEYSYEKDNFVKVAGKNGEEYFTFETSGIYELRATVKLIHNGNVVDSVGKVYHFLVNDKPLVTPTITQQPTNVTGATGSSATLTAKATDAASAQWYKVASNGFTTALTGSFSNGTATLTVNKSNNVAGDRYYCIFKSEDGSSVTTNMATVCFVPTVTSGSTVTVTAGQNAYLKVTASGCDHYDNANGWYKDGVSTEISSGRDYYVMGTTLCILAADASDAGTYTYKYVTHGKTVTGTVTLVVNSATSTNTIDTFDITGLDNPVILGTTADTSVSVPGSAKYTVESVTWTAGVNSSGVVTGSSGMVSVKLKAKSGYTFKSGDLRGTVEGITKTVYSVPSGATSITVNIDYNSYSSWKIVYPENDTVSISTDSLTFRKGTAANGQKITGSFTCTHGNLADTNLHHKGINFAVYSTSGNAMPAGLTLNKDGTITGTPTAAGVYTVLVEARSVNANGTASNCSGLVVKMIKIVVASENSHDWDIEHPEVITPATCTTDGVSRIKCKDTGCTAHQDVTVPSTGHNWGEWPTYIVPTCKDGSITITRTCGNANCPVKTESKTINGLHMAMDWTTDATDHWKVCTYGCGTILVDKAAHTDADSNNECDICSYKLPDPTTPTDPTDPTDPVDPTTQPTTGNPGGEGSTTPAPTTPAGDGNGNGGNENGGSNLWWLWILIAAVAIGGIVLFVILGKKKKEQ